MKRIKTKLNNRIKRHKKVRASVHGTATRPRLSVFRSNKYIFLQLIDDEKGKTIISASDLKNQKTGRKKTKTERAKTTGKELAKLAKAKKIKIIVFDRGGYKYHGRVKAVAEGAKEEGLKF